MWLGEEAASTLRTRLVYQATRGNGGGVGTRTPHATTGVCASPSATQAAERLVDDPEYREALRIRMIDGTAGAMEVLLWFYAKGKPVERVEQVARFPYAHLTDEELRVRLLDMAKSFTPAK